MGELKLYDEIEETVGSYHPPMPLEKQVEVIECYVHNSDQSLHTIAVLMQTTPQSVSRVIGNYLPKKGTGFKHVLVLQSKV